MSEINKEVFDQELALCRNFNGEKGGCNWGRCENCGAIPLLYKLYKNELLETKEEIVRVRGF